MTHRWLSVLLVVSLTAICANASAAAEDEAFCPSFVAPVDPTVEEKERVVHQAEEEEEEEQRVWFNEVGFAPGSANVSFIELAGSDWDRDFFLVGQNLEFTEVLRQNVRVSRVAGRRRLDFYRLDLPEPLLIQYLCIIAFYPVIDSRQRQIRKPQSCINWTGEDKEIRVFFGSTPAFSKNVLPDGANNETALSVEPNGVALSLFGKGTKLTEFDGYKLIPYKDTERRELETNPGQTILLPCYDALRISTQLKRTECYTLEAESCKCKKGKKDKVGTVCIDMVYENGRDFFEATYSFNEGYLGTNLSFGVFSRKAKKDEVLEDQATTTIEDLPLPERTLRVRIDEVPYDLKRKNDFITMLDSKKANDGKPFPKSFKKCCKTQRYIHLSGDAIVIGGGERVSFTAKGKGCSKSGLCKLKTECAPQPTDPVNLWINEISFQPAPAGSIITEPVIDYVEIAGTPKFFETNASAIEVGYIDRDGKPFRRCCTLIFKRDIVFDEEDGIYFAAALGLERFRPQTRNASALVLSYLYEDDEGINVEFLDVVKLIEEDISYEFYRPITEQNLPTITPPRSIPLQQEPFGTGFVRKGTGTLKEDFNFEQIVYNSSDKNLRLGLNEGQTILLPA